MKIRQIFLSALAAFGFLLSLESAFAAEKTLYLDCGYSVDSIQFSFAPDDKVAIAACDGFTYTLDVANFQILKRQDFIGGGARFNPAGTKVLNVLHYPASGYGPKLQEFDLQTSKERTLFAGEKIGTDDHITFSPERAVFLDDKTALFTAPLNSYIYQIKTSGPFRKKSDFYKTDNSVKDLRISNDRKKLVIEESFGTLSVLDLTTFKRVFFEKDSLDRGGFSDFLAKAFSKDSQSLIYSKTIGSTRTQIDLIALSSGKRICQFAAESVITLDIHPDKPFFLTADKNGLVQVYDSRTCGSVFSQTMSANGRALEDVKFSPNGHELWVAATGTISTIEVPALGAELGLH